MRVFRQLLCLTVLAMALAAVRPAGAAPRLDQSLDGHWRFLRQDAAGAEQPAFADADWPEVTLPHTWNAQDGADGGGNYYRGIGWYRRHLTVDSSLAGRSLFLKFDGAATVTDVFVNGQSVGEHRGNFAAFCFDVTRLLRAGQDNVLAVKVNNAFNPDVAPRSGDFTIFGGLYRKVHLLALSPLSVTPLDNAGPGVYVTQSHVTSEAADLTITTKLRNAADAPKDAAIRCIITDARGKTVQTTDTQQAVSPNGTADAIQRVTIHTPHLWDGVNDPYLYQISVEVRDGTAVVDRVVQPLGLRFFRVDPNQGLFLNGRHYALHGVNRHQDRQGKGWAIGPAEHREDYALIREMGSTGIRLSHYQHAQEFYDLCDRGGLVVWAELPLVNSLNQTDAFADNARQQFTELITQNYNHPAILFWSLFNELSFPSGNRNPQEWALIGQLNTLAHQMDPTRLTTAASNRPPEHPVNFITDLIAFNRYYGWYGGKPDDWPAALDRVHAQYPTRCIAISEYGAGASVRQHEADPRQPTPGGRWHPEEWQTTVHETVWNAMQSRPYLWGTFLWAMFDFASDGRREGDTPGRNDKGMVTYDRKTRKDAFFWYKANWTTAPFVDIAERRFSPRSASPASVQVVSNCDSVELTVNGRSLGRKTAAGHLFRWDGVMLANGENRIEAVGRQGGKTYQDRCVWTYTPAPTTPPSGSTQP